ncbi:TonB-dependent copper receptor [Pontibacterium granulatum]|uniref:TonB-dependent copper receptor n=1 Tax=Pontibacterium granulatum TaxID=2036029 RepID=UPI00249C84CC|nr:TonB-dependent copper receptor [Pontibacterium granulatum]MDI3324529.1 TonB-dependent copper receptor [Pontibacterium granulatum]
MNKQALTIAVAMAVSTMAQAADSEGNLVIEINRGLPQLETTVRETTTGVQASPVSDGGELLKSLTGVSGIRMGGRAIDPVIRGQKETQLNILLDGGYIHGGCPNRMDPPTAYTSVESYDRVTVIKGNRTVVYGGGGSGGTVLFERDWPMIDEKGYNVELAGSYEGNGDKGEVGFDAAMGDDDTYLRFIAHHSEAQDYVDGNGNKVDAEYESDSNALLAGIRLSEHTTLEASVEKSGEEDVEFPGAMMDSPFADSESTRLKLTHDFRSSPIQYLRVDLYQSNVDHLMENTTMEAPSTSDTKGFRVLLEANAADIDWTFGVDTQNNDRNAQGNMVSSGAAVFSHWPGVAIDQTGLFVEGEKALGEDDVLKAGLRYDRVDASASRANEAFGMGGVNTPTNLYNQKYGTTDTDSTEDNVGGLISWTHRIDDQYSVETTFSRSVRTADATERYIAKANMMGMGAKWVGNPQIEPEKHHQLEVALASNMADLNWMLSGWYNRVDDYILRQTVSGDDIYRNIDAELYGVEFEVTYQLNSNITLGSSLAWLQGNNEDGGTDLSRISPLELTNSLDYVLNNWKAGVEWKLVDAQNDVCLSDSSCGGQDVRATQGYGLVNLHGEYTLPTGVTVAMGVDNLFDKFYTLHESRDYLLDSDPVQVAEPGRNVWLRLSGRF